MKKVISFCIWGKKAIYNYGLYEIAVSLPEKFPGWEMVVYYTPTANRDVILELKRFDYVECIMVDFPNHYRNSMIRFMAAFNPKYDVVIFRDADSRLIKRDYYAVEDWLKSKKKIHILRDYPTNGIKYRISAGMWGVRDKFLLRKDVIANFANHFSNYDNVFRIDEIFLFKYVYPLVNAENSVIHAAYNKFEDWAKNFPAICPSGNYIFVGKTFYNTPIASKKFRDPKILQEK